MPPKRRGKKAAPAAAKRAKKEDKEQEKSSSRSDNNNKAAMEDAPITITVQDLLSTCLGVSATRSALHDAVDKGYRQSVVWPALRKTTTERRDEDNKQWLDLCFLGATLLSFEFREGSPKQNLVELDEECTVAWLETLCRGAIDQEEEEDNLHYATTVAHVLDILLASIPPSSSSHLYSTLVAQLGGVTIYHFLPAHRKELEDRRGKLDKPAGEKVPELAPILLRLMDTLLVQLEQQAKDKEENDDEKDSTTAQQNNNSKTLFVHRCLELLIDVLSVWETRKYLVPYMEATHFHIKCQRASSSSVLTRQLLHSVQTLLKFPLDPYTGQPQSAAERLALYHRRASTLQKMAHRHYQDTLPDVIYSGIGILCSDRKFLRRSVAGLPDDELTDFCKKMKLIGDSQEDNCERDFLLQVLEDFLIIPSDPLEELRKYPLYPTEAVLWDVNRIPPSRRSRESTASPVLSLPKLQNSFLSFADYLLRNFTLTRLETAYAIRTDLVDVIRRLNPVVRHSMNEDDENPDAVTLKTEFSGWARMALELQSPVEIVKVEKPLLGTNHPASVHAVIKVDLKSCADSLRNDWDSLSEFDNLFLVSINAAKMTGAGATEDAGKPIPDDDDPSFPQRYGVTAVRGCMIAQVRDEEDNVGSEQGASAPKGTARMFRVLLDPHQFSLDAKSKSGTDIYQTFNLVVRRQGRENNFRAILETTRGLLSGNAAISRVLPPWLQPILLGHGDPSGAHYKSETVREYAKKTVGVADPDSFLDFGDTFIDEAHLCESFPGAQVTVDGKKTSGKGKAKERRNYRVRVDQSGKKTVVEVESYGFPGKGNSVRFTPVQVEAIRSGLSCGLTCVVGPPGTGKTDVAVQVIACLYHSYPTQRTIVITHSNAALNDIFSKVMARGDVDERYMVRLGSGERDLETQSTHDFTKPGRVAYSLGRRAELLEQVQQISESLGLSGKAERGKDGSPSYTCETAAIFYENQIRRKLRGFRNQATEKELTKDDSDVTAIFPFTTYFKESTVTWSSSTTLLRRLAKIFEELAEYRPLELLRSQRQKTDYLLIKQARVVAMTCTHAAIARSHLLELGFEYDNLVIEESGQMTEVDTIIPFLLQKSESDSSDVGLSRLKRVCLMGDHHQLPPVIKNQTFSRYSNLDQSLFGRLISFGVPRIQLDRQGRARSELARFYSWRYNDLGNLAHVDFSPSFQAANAGFAHAFQFIQVDAFRGKGETTPTPFYYQNMGEAEYAVALFQYMVLIGYEPNRISILAAYNGQKELIRDILSQRCGEGTPLEGIRPAAVSTVDQYQGQQNDIIILSLVRTEALGHLRDIRRWVVALSRARLGLYILGRSELYKAVHDLQPIVQVWEERPHQLELIVGETAPTERQVIDKVPEDDLFRVESVDQLGAMVYKMQEQLMEQDEGGEAHE
eukprot:scaffold1803_cov92-Amphora_coffeaeformis.AAC.46